MDKSQNLSALKHGAFSEVLFLPGEDPQEFEKLKNGLFAEYKPSGVSEEKVMESIAKALWQERRFGVYQYVQYLRRLGRNGYLPDPMEKAMVAWELAARKEGEPRSYGGPIPGMPKIPDVQSDEDALLELGNLVTLDHLDKELDVDNKLQSKIDRLFKRFFQMKAMKPLIGLGESPAPALISETPMLELTATDATKTSELLDDTPASELIAVDPVKSQEE